jgi:CRISPR-associated endonuclease/helicase Cas3
MALEEVWAKSGHHPGEPGQPLVLHTRMVLACLADLRVRQPMLARLCREPRLWHRAALACALHDLGKCAPGFQRMLRDGPAFGHRHEVISLAILPYLIGRNAEDDLPWVAAGIVSHHRELRELRRLYPPGDPSMDLADGCETLREVLDRASVETMWTVATEHLLPAAREAGLLDGGRTENGFAAPDFDDWAAWLPENVRLCLTAVEFIAREAVGRGPRAIACRLVRGLVLLSDHAGSAGEVFARVPALESPAAMVEALSRVAATVDLYEHQREALRAGSRAVLIAPTGSGKTEAALIWAAGRRGPERGRSPIFYLLPYQASLNAMRARLGALFGDDRVVLQHSRAVQALYRQLLGRGYLPSHAQRLAVRERSLARLHVAPVRVLTPYQLLRGAYQLPGHPALWTDAAGGIFVVDEVHAYETTRLGMIIETLAHLSRDLEASVLVMSATLPSVLRQALDDAIGPLEEVRASMAMFREFSRHRLRIRAGDLVSDETLREVVEAAQRGLAVLVVATTVGRAQQIWKALRDPTRLGPSANVRLLHGRFCGRDRFAKEDQLRNAVATRLDSSRRQPIVLVATQVVEVSLDIDFDILFSDPAPLEALVQRFGRVNRRRRLASADVVVMTAVPRDSSVYPEPLVEQTLKTLGPLDGTRIDEADIQALIDGVYDGDIGKRWRKEVARAGDEFRRSVLDGLEVFDSSPELAHAFDELFDGSEVLPALLEEPFEEMNERQPLLAPSLLVPVTSGQLSWLGRQRRLRFRADGVAVADVPYDSETGLDVSAARRDGP